MLKEGEGVQKVFETEQEIRDIEFEKPDETPEQKEKREFKENVDRLIKEAEAFVKIEKIKKISEKKEQEEKKEEPLVNLETIKNEMHLERKGKLPAIKDSFRKIALRLKDVKDTESTLALIYYFEKNYYTTAKIKSIESKSGNEEKLIAKQKKKGLEFLGEREVNKIKWLDFQEKKNFEFPLKWAKDFSELYQKQNDPIELINNLQKMGFYTHPANVRYALTGFKRITEQKDVSRALNILINLGVKAEYLQASYRRENELTPEVFEKIETITPSLIKIAENEKSLKLLKYLNGPFSEREILSKDQLEKISLFEEMGLTEKILELTDKPVSFYNTPLYDLMGLRASVYGNQEDYKNKLEEIMRDLKTFLESEQIQEFLSNKEFFDFTEKVSILRRIPINLNELPRYKKLASFPEALGVLKLLKDWDIKFDWYEDVKNLLENESALKLAAMPDMQKFIKEFQNKLNYKINLNDIIYESARNKIMEIFENPGQKEKFFSEKGIETIKYLGGFKELRHKDYYLDFLNIPDSLETLKKLQECFLKEPRFYFSDNFHELYAIVKEKGLQEKLFDSKITEFFTKVHKEFGYDLKINEVGDLISISENEEIKNLILSDKNIAFINQGTNYEGRIKNLEMFANLADEYKNLILNLNKEFGFKAKRGYAALNLHNENFLRQIINDPELQKNIFNEENISFIKTSVNYFSNNETNLELIISATAYSKGQKSLVAQLNKDFNYKIGIKSILSDVVLDSKMQKDVMENRLENYQAKLAQKIGICFLYEGDRGHELLENIKEKGWITIQTYNRLYAARRKFIGFDSYAYLPKTGREHPTINVTYYGMEFGENELLNKAKFEVNTGYQDSGNFYDGSLGTMPIKVYPENYKIYEQTLKRYESLNDEEKKKFLQNFSWFEKPKQSKDDKEIEFLANNALPFGVAPNGHTHFYVTTYGIVSGCVSEASEQSGILKNNHPAAKSVGVITGHREMLLDFLKTQGKIFSSETGEETIPKGAITVKIKNLDLPKQLEQMILPPNITLGEVILNLHLEQYLHKEIEIRDGLLKEIMGQFDYDEIVVRANGKILKLEDKIEPNAKVVFEARYKEALAA